MGVHHLWSILEPSKQEESIDKLRDKTLCVDLSLWICEAQGTKGLKNQLKPYLRNVFFRTLYLASLGVRPVFVVDGVPPEIKRETIVKRLQARGAGGAHSVSTNGQKQRKLNRSKFTMQCNECCQMMGLLGVPFVKSDGEAEATCAWLNENHYADGVLTDDGDVFLYGAKVVYKDFNVSSSKSPTDHLQVFRLEEIKSNLGLTRRNMIALALLLGCDYLPAGVPGVGKETAMKLVSSLSGVDLLDRFDVWKLSPDAHVDGLTSLEVAVKRKAVKLADFPNKAVIKEFLSPKVGKVNANLQWRCPDLEGIKEFFFRKLDWPKEYTEEKMLILVTDWQLANMNPSRTLFSPTRIVKARIRQGKDYYEIEWTTEDQTSKWPKTFVSVKSKEIIFKTFPRLVEKFEADLLVKKKKGKTKKSQKSKTSSDQPDCVDDLLTKVHCMNLNKNANTVEQSSDDCKEDHLTWEALAGKRSAGKPESDRHEGYTNYEVEDNSSAGNVIKYSQTFQDDVFEPADSLNSPAVIEKTVYNLADITIDQTFGIELGGVDDLLSDSFIASLQAVTPIRHGAQSLQSARRDYSNSNDVSIDPNPVPNENLSTFEDDVFGDSVLNLNITPTEVEGEESSTVLDGLNRKDEFSQEAKTKGLVVVSDTPSPRETTSLASRLLKRFQTENRTNMADNLLCISGENALIYGGNKVNISAESFTNRDG